jgi:hypothetical protein
MVLRLGIHKKFKWYSIHEYLSYTLWTIFSQSLWWLGIQPIQPCGFVWKPCITLTYIYLNWKWNLRLQKVRRCEALGNKLTFRVFIQFLFLFKTFVAYFSNLADTEFVYLIHEDLSLSSPSRDGEWNLSDSPATTWSSCCHLPPASEERH